MSVGVLGLIDAAGRYKPTLGVPFDAFARRRVQGAMLDSLRDLDWAPRSLRRLRRDVDARRRRRCAASSDASRRSRRSPRRWACRWPSTSKTLEQLRTLDLGAVALARRAGARTARRASSCASIPARASSQQLERKELRAHLAKAIEQLPERERQILALYYEEELTLAEIGAGHRRRRVARVAAALAGAVAAAHAAA